MCMLASILLTSLCAQACPSLTIHGRTRLERLGHIVRSAGDLDLDGFDDVLITAPGLIFGYGHVQAHSGKDGALLFDWRAAQPGTEFGSSADTVGDVNLDGRPDVVIGELTYANARGRSVVFSGLTGDMIYELLGPQPGAFLGFGVTGLGDVDGDGRADFAVAIETPAQVLIVSPAQDRIVAVIQAPSSGSGFGKSMARLGDVNLDGRSDLAICHRGHDGPNGFTEGAVHVVSGADGSPIYTVLGGAAGYGFGEAITVVGDWTQDGVADFVASGISYYEQRLYMRCHDGKTGQQYLGELVPQDRSAGRILASGQDWTNDGIPDLAYGTLSGSASAIRVLDARSRQVVYELDGVSLSYWSDSSPLAMIPSRLGDARPELVIGNPGESAFALSSGTARFVVSCDPLRIQPPTPGIAGVANAFIATDVPAGAMVHWAGSRTLGSSPIFACPDLQLQLHQPTILGHDAPDRYGIARLILNVPISLAGKTMAFQAWIGAPCSVSQVVIARFQ